MSNKDMDKALAILRGTKDGDELSPTHLKIVEMYVNGQLNERGLQEFDKIYESVAAGNYQALFHLGVEHMTYDHEGYIYFKGQYVEHYSRPWAYSLDARADLIRLQQKCLYLESKGFEVNSVSTVWGWDGHAAKFGKQKKSEFDNLIPAVQKIIFSEVTAGKDKGNSERFLMSGRPDESAARTSPRYLDFCSCGKLGDNEDISITAYSYGSGTERDATGEEMAAVSLCLDYLKENELLPELSKTEYYARDSTEYNGYESDCGSQDDEDEFER